MHEMLDSALIDGQAMPLAAASVPVTDDGVARGDGAFETVGVWDGRPFRAADHLDRLSRSLAAIGLPPVDTGILQAEIEQLLADVAVDAALRIYVTGSGTRILTLSAQPVRPPTRHLVPQPAPWIRPLGTYGPAGAKTMSYMPNMAATRAAVAAGGDDALLVSLEGLVLEGPTFCLLWVHEGVLRTPSVDLGVVDSISRRALLELAAEAGYTVAEGHWPLDDLADASELLVCSSVRPLTAARSAGDFFFAEEAPVTDELGARLDAQRRGRG